LALVLGILVRTASFFGLIYMLTLLFSSTIPARTWRFGNTLALPWITQWLHCASRRLRSPTANRPSR